MYRYIKRILDFIFSFVLIMLFIPVFVIIALLIWLSMGWPVIFSQKRVGLNNVDFRIYKFRSMCLKTDKHKTDAERITLLGKILRISRIDEFPQLLNVFKGDMSFIGPRPLLPEYLPYYSEEEIRRHEVRPGLSGLSQVDGSYPSWEMQFENDISYVKNLSFTLDAKILLKTIAKVLLPSRKLVTGNSGRLRFDDYRIKQKQL